MKFQARGQLEIAQKEIILLKNKLMMIQVDESIKLVKQQAIDAISNGKKAVILELNIGTDAKAIKRVLDEIKKVTDDKISFLCISKEENNGKITVFNYVTEEEQSKGTHSLTYLLTHLLTHSYLLTHSLLLTYLLTHSRTHLLTHSRRYKGK